MGDHPNGLRWLASTVRLLIPLCPCLAGLSGTWFRYNGEPYVESSNYASNRAASPATEGFREHLVDSLSGKDKLGMADHALHAQTQ